MAIIVGREVWQLSHLFAEVKKDYTRVYADAVEHALLRLAFLSTQSDEFIRYDAEHEVLGYYNREGGLYRKIGVDRNQPLTKLVEGPMFDIRDTSKWTLRALNRGFQERLASLGERCVPVVFSLKDNGGEEIARYQSGLLRGVSPCRVSVSLGYSQRNELEVTCDFTWREFWREAGSTVLLLAALFVLLVVCVVLLLRLVHQERKIAAFRDMFVKAFTHDLKAPAATVSNGLYLLEQQLPPTADGERRKTLADLRRASRRVQEAINKLLAALVRGHGVSLRREPVDIHELLRRFAGERPWKTDGGKPCEVSLDLRAARTLVMADKALLEFALQNVVENAVKYADPGVRVVISTADEGKWLRLDVEDNGWGIPPECLRRVFEPGFRVPLAADKVRGSGIGLSVIRQIVVAHRGTVAIESRLGEGTKVIISLPLMLERHGK